MNKKYIFISIFILFAVLFIIYYNSNTSFAYKYSDYKYNLFYKEDTEELNSEIQKYLNDINKYIFRNSNFEIYDNLVDNTDFITYFAIDLILDNYEQFKDEIVTLEEVEYYDKRNNKKTTDKYINLNTLYNITYKYFGVKNYLILSDKINIIDDNISLSRYSDDNVNITINKVNTTKDNKYIYAIVETEDKSKYKYTFTIKDNILRLYNVEVI